MRTFHLLIIALLFAALIGGTGSLSASAVGPEEGLLVLSNDKTGESVLVYCQGGLVDALVSIKNGQAGPNEGAPMGAPCSVDSFDGFEKDLNTSPYYGWVVKYGLKNGIGAYACTQEGTVYAFKYPDSDFYSFEDPGTCYPGIMPG